MFPSPRERERDRGGVPPRFHKHRVRVRDSRASRGARGTHCWALLPPRRSPPLPPRPWRPGPHIRHRLQPSVLCLTEGAFRVPASGMPSGTPLARSDETPQGDVSWRRSGAIHNG